MVLVFILLFLISLFVLIMLVSNLKISINKLELSNEIDNTEVLKEFSMSVGIYAFNKIRIFNKNIKKQDLQRAKNSKKVAQLKDKFLNNKDMKEKKKTIKTDIDIFKNLEPNLQELELELKLGTEDVVLTSFIIAIISIIIAMLLSKAIKNYDEKKYKYIIVPNYNNKNSIKVILKGIIDIKLVNIISILFKLVFRSDYFVKRTSNRRTHANSHEQYPRNDRCKYNYRRAN